VEDRPETSRLRLQEAAGVLGTTVDALRKRVQRGTIESERDDEGRVWILLDTLEDTRPDTGQPPPDSTMLISRLEDEVRFLREELARKDAIMLRMAESIGREIEAPERPQEPPESPGPTETPTEGSRAPQSGWESLRDEPERTEPRSSTPGPQEGAERPWWRRVFGG
jgi:hypothetical protein